MIKELTSFIATRSGFTLGVNIVHGVFLQDNPDRCVLVAYVGGGAVEFDLPDRADVVVQVLARAVSYEDANEDAQAIYDALHGQAGWTLPTIGSGGSYRAHSITAMTYPQYLGPDGNGLHQWICNYIFRVANAAI